MGEKSAGGAAGIRAKKWLGQNFLVNPRIAPKMVEMSGVDGGYGILEIGAGYGALTKELLKVTEKVAAVEIDSELAERLRAEIGAREGFSVACADVLKSDLRKLIAQKLPGGPTAVFGNLPYYITSPIIMKLLEERLPVDVIVVMVQKEAARRITAAEGSRLCGALTLAVRYYSEPEVLFDVSPGSFYPVPKVSSSVIRLAVKKLPPADAAEEAFMFRVIKAAFAQRRKMILNAVSGGLGVGKREAAAAFEDCGINPENRAENLLLRDYAALAVSLRKSVDRR